MVGYGVWNNIAILILKIEYVNGVAADKVMQVDSRKTSFSG
jgi:hypothetical protein